jgi:hypothetical protein
MECCTDVADNIKARQWDLVTYYIRLCRVYAEARGGGHDERHGTFIQVLHSISNMFDRQLVGSGYNTACSHVHVL